MTAPEFDPRDVLEKYVTILSRPESSIIRDLSELAHHKDAIKAVLQHCIRTAADRETRDFLKEAYASLSNFQTMTDAEKEAVAVLNKVGTPEPEGSKLFGKQAREITHVAAPLQALLDRITAERAVLGQELKSLTGES
jgi:hypothetical protein